MDLLSELKRLYGYARAAEDVKKTDLLLRAIMYCTCGEREMAIDLLREHGLLFSVS